MEMFKVERYRARTVVTSLLAGLVIAIPLCLLAVHSRQTVPEIQPAVRLDTEPETETVTVIEYFKAYHEYSFMSYLDSEKTISGAAYYYSFISLSEDMQNQIYTICANYEISYELILAVIKTESEFQWVIGDEGQAVGYMQIWPKWWQGTADEHGLDINNPIDNVHLGIIILTDALDDNCGDLNKALKQYNSGNPHYQGNEYIDKVFENYEWIEGELNDVDR